MAAASAGSLRRVPWFPQLINSWKDPAKKCFACCTWWSCQSLIGNSVWTQFLTHIDTLVRVHIGWTIETHYNTDPFANLQQLVGKQTTRFNNHQQVRGNWRYQCNSCPWPNCPPAQLLPVNLRSFNDIYLYIYNDIALIALNEGKTMTCLWIILTKWDVGEMSVDPLRAHVCDITYTCLIVNCLEVLSYHENGQQLHWHATAAAAIRLLCCGDLAPKKTTQ